MKLPTFIIGGAPRSGTTWLAHLCNRHPEIYMAQPIFPEPKFFHVDDLYARGLDYYASFFTAARDVKAIGEKSTNYLESRSAAARMRRDIPDVKLVFILRNPVTRAYSNYAWSWMNGRETATFAEALAREDERERSVAAEMRYARPHAYFSRGLYADLLAPYVQLFPRAQVRVLTFEHAVSQPRESARGLHEFLGVTPRPEDADSIGRLNQSVPPADAMSAEVCADLKRRYRDSNVRLAALLGQDFSIWDDA